MIPYPLSTGSKCGDPMYFNFECNITTGQVQLKVPGGTYRVTSINPETLTFVIQLKESDCSSRSLINKIPPLNPPFHMTNVCTVVKIDNFGSEKSLENSIEIVGIHHWSRCVPHLQTARIGLIQIAEHKMEPLSAFAMKNLSGMDLV